METGGAHHKGACVPTSVGKTAPPHTIALLAVSEIQREGSACLQAHPSGVLKRQDGVSGDTFRTTPVKRMLNTLRVCVFSYLKKISKIG
jgi:hypothetical protein